MLGIGMPELLLILVVALIVIGPKNLPDIAKTLGKAMGEFKRAANDLKESMELEELQNVRKTFNDLNREISEDPSDKKVYHQDAGTEDIAETQTADETAANPDAEAADAELYNETEPGSEPPESAAESPEPPGTGGEIGGPYPESTPAAMESLETHATTESLSEGAPGASDIRPETPAAVPSDQSKPLADPPAQAEPPETKNSIDSPKSEPSGSKTEAEGSTSR